jgi:hypothetical protein
VTRRSLLTGHERRRALLLAEPATTGTAATEARRSGVAPAEGRPGQTCELRDDSKVGAGWDVMVLEDGEPLFSRRCVDEKGARYVAESFKQDLLRTGWAE